jgi:peptidyl-prolyl cis-trans isomerase C
MSQRLCLSILIAVLIYEMALPTLAQNTERVLATVNGEPITEGDLQFLMLLRRVPPEMREQVRERFLEQLIDSRLMRAYLAGRKAEALPDELQREVRDLLELIRKQGEDPQQVLAELGLSEQRLREEAALPLAWQRYVQRIATPQELRDYYSAHRQELDGTEVRARQIFLKLPKDDAAAEVDAARSKLQRIRSEIESGKLTFAEAAKQHSEAPTRDNGGDVGFFPFRGKMPAQIADVAFRLKNGEISEPFRTPFGMHLVTVTERKPGDLSLEDVRAVVLNRLSEAKWREIVAEQRAKAKIEYAK